MSEYTNRANAADTARDEAFDMGGKWTRGEYLALAQVHATLAVAAALQPPMRYMLGIDDKTMTDVPKPYYVEPPHAAEDAFLARMKPLKDTGWTTDAFTDSERADEVGA